LDIPHLLLSSSRSPAQSKKEILVYAKQDEYASDHHHRFRPVPNAVARRWLAAGKKDVCQVRPVLLNTAQQEDMKGNAGRGTVNIFIELFY
jgi:hypothetical protein